MSSSRLEALLEMSDTIAGTRDLKDLLHTLAPSLKKAVDFDYVALILHDPETDQMNLHVIEILFETEPPSVSVPMDRSPSGLCFRTQQPLIIDVDTESRFPEDVMAVLRRYLIKSCCYLPLTTSLRRLGAITFGSRQ